MPTAPSTLQTSTLPGTLLLLCIVLLSVFPIDMLLPSFPALAEQFSRSPADIALSISLFAIVVAVSQLLVGPLCDVLGRKRLLLLGLALASFGGLGAALAQSFAVFMAFRLLQALACGCFVVAHALIQDLFEDRQRRQIRVMLTTAGGVFIASSPLLGSELEAALSWQASFYSFVFLSLGVLMFALIVLEDDRPVAGWCWLGAFQVYGSICTHPLFISYSLISALAFACHFSFMVLSPLILMGELGLSAQAFSLTLLSYGAAFLASGVAAARLARMLEPESQIRLGILCIALAGVTLLILLNHPHALLAIMLPAAMVAVGTTLIRPAATCLALELFEHNAGAAAAMGSTLVLMLGGLASAFINASAGSLRLELGAFCIVAGALAMLALLLIAHFLNKTRPACQR